MAKKRINTTIRQLKPGHKTRLSLSEFLDILKNRPKSEEVEIPREQWKKLSPSAKEMVRKRQITWLTTA